MKLFKQVIFVAAKKLNPEYGDFALQVAKNRVRKLLKGKRQNKFVFILSAPLSGSTLLNEILSTSNNVSANNSWGTREGQKLPTVRQMMFDHNNRWDADLAYDWHFIRKEWLKYWDTTKPLLLEKSPQNIIRAQQINASFRPAYFIILVRNPYAQCEGLLRRRNMTPSEAAEFSMMCMRHQLDNLEKLENKIVLSYESLCDNPKEAASRLSEFIPEIGDLDLEKTFSAHNVLGKNVTITNLNDNKIARLSKQDIEALNEVFKKHETIFNAFKYKLI